MRRLEGDASGRRNFFAATLPNQYRFIFQGRQGGSGKEVTCDSRLRRQCCLGAVSQTRLSVYPLRGSFQFSVGYSVQWIRRLGVLSFKNY